MWVVRSLRSDRRQEHDSAGRADTLLAERFVRGEIEIEEFSRASDLLHSGSASQPQRGR